jgi:hypothetical protein
MSEVGLFHISVKFVLRDGYSMSHSPPLGRIEGPPHLPQRSASECDEQLSSEYEEDAASASLWPVFSRASYQGPWDEFVKPYNHQFICVWEFDGDDCGGSDLGRPERHICGRIGDKRHLITRHIKTVHLKIRFVS